MRHLKRFWLNLSISMKSLCIQLLLITLPLILGIFIFLHNGYSDLLSSAARVSYEYSRATIDSFEASMLKVKAAANVILASPQLRDLLNVEDGHISEHDMGRMNSLITGTVNIYAKVNSTVLYATPFSDPDGKTGLPLYPAEEMAGVRTGWQFDYDTEQNRCTAQWIQATWRDDLPAAVLSIRLNEDILSSEAESIATLNGGCCAIFDAQGHVLYQSQNMDDNQFQLLAGMLPGGEGYHIVNNSAFINMINCGAMNLIFVTTGSITPSLHTISAQWLTYFFWFLLFLSLMLLAIYMNHTGVTRRIKSLSDQISMQSKLVESMQRLEELKTIQIAGEDEIGELATNYNHLIAQLVESANREKQLELLQQTAKFSALQAQIQPHFLYNTLETLRMMAYEKDDMEVADMLLILGKLMRSSISGREQETTLQKELVQVENYLKLNNLRFQRLHYAIQCDMNVENFICPRFILQPLVENSIHHGISRVRKDCTITLHVYQDQEFCVVDVTDDGIGIDPERLEEIRASLKKGVALEQVQGGIGIYNVHTRLKIYFGESSGLEITSTPGVETQCRIRMIINGRRNRECT